MVKICLVIAPHFQPALVVTVDVDHAFINCGAAMILVVLSRCIVWFMQRAGPEELRLLLRIAIRGKRTPKGLKLAVEIVGLAIL